MTSRLVLITLAAAVAVFASAAPAGAAQVSLEGNTLVYRGDPSEANKVQVSTAVTDFSCGGVVAPPCIKFWDSGAHIRHETDQCALISVSEITGDEIACAGHYEIRATLGDRDDSWWDAAGSTVIDAGAGNDNPIFGGEGNDSITGGPGNDVLVGGMGDDSLDGGPGDDALEGIPGEVLGSPESFGADTYTGGGGSDAVIYTNRTEDLKLSPDGAADDGAAGEGDNIAPDIGSVYGGTGDDVFEGNAGGNLFSGDGGNDTLNARDGDDFLYGGNGDDVLDAGPGQDYLEGDNADDTLIGGPDADQFYGEDPLAQGGGRDRIVAADGIAERIHCGPGIDSTQADVVDEIWNHPGADQCEEIALSGGVAGGGGNPGGGNAGGGPGVAGGTSLRIARAAANRRGVIVLDLAVPGAGAVSVKATARNGGRTVVVGRARASARAAGSVRLSIKPSTSARRLLKKRGRLSVTVVVSYAPAGGGEKTSARRTVVLRKRR